MADEANKSPATESPPAPPSPRKGSAATVRRVVMLLVVATIAFFVWRSMTRREDYTGGNVVATGTVEAVHVRLGFKVGGRLADVPVSEGDVVQTGQVVARLEPQDFQVQARSARSTVEAARAEVAQARAAREKARRDLARIRTLVQSEAATPQQLDAARAAAAEADAGLQAAVAQVHQAESALAQAELQLSYAELRAPQPGLVSEKIHHPGETVMVGTAVITVAQVDTVKVHAPVDETRVGAVRPGDRVRVRVYTFDRQVFEGVVSDVEPVGEFATRKDWGARRRDIRTFDVTASVPNPAHLLKDGMTAEVTILVDPSVQGMGKRAQGGLTP